MKQLAFIVLSAFKYFNYLMQKNVPSRFVVILLFPHFSLRKKKQLAKNCILYCQLRALSFQSQIGFSSLLSCKRNFEGLSCKTQYIFKALLCMCMHVSCVAGTCF